MATGVRHGGLVFKVARAIAIECISPLLNNGSSPYTLSAYSKSTAVNDYASNNYASTVSEIAFSSAEHMDSFFDNGGLIRVTLATDIGRSELASFFGSLPTVTYDGITINFDPNTPAASGYINERPNKLIAYTYYSPRFTDIDGYDQYSTPVLTTDPILAATFAINTGPGISSYRTMYPLDTGSDVQIDVFLSRVDDKIIISVAIFVAGEYNPEVSVPVLKTSIGFCKNLASSTVNWPEYISSGIVTPTYEVIEMDNTWASTASGDDIVTWRHIGFLSQAVESGFATIFNPTLLYQEAAQFFSNGGEITWYAGYDMSEVEQTVEELAFSAFVATFTGLKLTNTELSRDGVVYGPGWANMVTNQAYDLLFTDTQDYDATASITITVVKNPDGSIMWFTQLTPYPGDSTYTANGMFGQNLYYRRRTNATPPIAKPYADDIQPT